MINLHVVKIVDLIGSPYFFSSEDGEKVFNVVVEAIDHRTTITLSFAGVEDLTTAFLNVAIGRLYERFTSEQIHQYIEVVDLDHDDTFLINRVSERAKEYYADPIRIENLGKAIARELGYSDD